MIWVIWAEMQKLLRTASIQITISASLLFVMWAYATTGNLIAEGYWDASLVDPSTSLSYTSSIVAAVGTLLTVFIGAVAVGLEFGYKTWPALLTHGAQRWQVWLVKLFSVAGVVAAWVLAALILGYLSSTWASGKISLPVISGTVLAQIGTLFSLLLFWAVFSFTFALALRGTGAGVVMGIAFQAANMMLEGSDKIKVWLPIWNQRALIAAAWGTNQQGVATFNADPMYPPVAKAVTLVTIMLVVLVIASYCLTQRLRTD